MNDAQTPTPGPQGHTMAERLVQVDSLEDGFAWVVADRMGGCGSCPEKGACGHAALLGEAPPIHMKLKNTLGVRPGDWIALGVSSNGLVASLGIAYGMPVLGFLIGTLVGSALGGTAMAMLSGALGLGAAFLGCRHLFKADHDHAAPTMLRKMPPPTETCCDTPENPNRS
ncbi:MAG: SoxR reducing system RseC family protein [Rhodospirillaceae bacterium]|nr:SoxR reducing system RseC family protein [Rhodospirillaceae bacterium]